MAKLVVTTKGLPPAAHELGQEWVTIGRGDSNTFQVVEPSISGRHCEVQLRGAELVVRDLLSTNGTFVAGKKVSEAVLKPGQTLRLGDVEFRFEASTQHAIFAAISAKNPVAAPPPPVPAVVAKPDRPAPAGGEPARKSHVLFVDDSLAFIETFGGLCAELSNHAWEIHSATSADRALAVLQEAPVDLVILDIGMPMVDGIQLLGIINRRYPGLKIAVMTGSAGDTHRAACLAGGAELFIEKPLSADASRVVFNLLNDLVSWAHRDGFSGALRQVGLHDVVQMECVGGRSSILEIRNTQLRGQIYIESGAITHAAVGTLVGKHAFYRLLSLKGGEFQLKPFTPPPQRTVQDRWEHLLMDAARVCDEETSFIGKTQPPAVAPAPPANVPVPQSAPPAEPPVKTSPPVSHAGPLLPGDDFVVVATYNGKWVPNDGPRK